VGLEERGPVSLIGVLWSWSFSNWGKGARKSWLLRWEIQGSYDTEMHMYRRASVESRVKKKTTTVKGWQSY